MTTNINNECIAYKARKVTRVITNIYNVYLKESGITIMQFNLLHEINDKATLSERELGGCLYMNHSTINRNIGYLERMGYVKAFRVQDKRVNNYYLTASGKEVIEKALPMWEKAQKDVLFRMGKPPLFDIFKEEV